MQADTSCRAQFSLPMLAPLLIGTGIALKSIQANASFLFPRIGLMVILTWGLWFANRVVANSALYLRRQVGHACMVPGQPAACSAVMQPRALFA